MRPEEIFETWVRPGGTWSVWAKPVLFAQIADRYSHEASADEAGKPWLGLDVSWAPPPQDCVALVLDLPGEQAVYLGLALASRGYRPVPLFNACTGTGEVIPQGAIQRALREGTTYLAGLRLPADAPPAFLLDQLRLSPQRPIRPLAFDNRWQVYPEDFPSGEVLRARGCGRVMLVQRGAVRPLDDLALVLWHLQEEGLTILVKDAATALPPQPFHVPRPGRLRRWWERLLALLRLRRSPAIGFGYVVPEPTHG
jgi:hypothetical protein